MTNDGMTEGGGLVLLFFTRSTFKTAVILSGAEVERRRSGVEGPREFAAGIRA